MKTWSELAEEQWKTPAQPLRNAANECRVVLGKFKELGLITQQQVHAATTVAHANAISKFGEKRAKHSAPGFRTLDISTEGTTLRLWIYVQANRRKEVSQFVLHGDVARRGKNFTVAVHLDDGPKGEGHCSHPPLHAHVDDGTEQMRDVRVPMAPLTAAQCLQWLLAAVFPHTEPAKHTGNPAPLPE
jgi:hypothetical protein